MLLGGWLAGSRSPILLSLAIACLAAAILGHVSHSADLMLGLLTVVICCSLAWLFGRTLFFRTYRASLTDRRADAWRAPGTGRALRLSAHAIWTLFFILMGVESILLGLFASPLLWSVFTNFINYLLIALFFVLEYPVRLWALRDLEHTSFIDSLRGSIRMGLR